MKNFEKKKKAVRKVFAVLTVLTLIFAFTATIALAAPDDNGAITAVQNLSSFLFTILKVVGGILIGYGILQVGMSIQSHDPSQRSQGILAVVGGILIAFAETIVNAIAG